MIEIYPIDLIARRPGGHVIANRTFENAVIRGPAVVYPYQCTFVRCTFSYEGDSIEGIIWELDPHRGTVFIGPIVFDHCSFTDCTFEGIGFAVEPDMASTMRAQIAPE